MISNTGFKKNNLENDDVAIIGVGFRLPGSSNDPLSFWNNLVNKFNGICDATKDHERWSENHFYSNEIKTKNAGLVSIDQWKSFDPLLFGIAPNEANQIDPQQRLLLKSTWEALEDAGIDPFKVRGTDTSVYMGVTSVDYQRTAFTEKDNSINFLGNCNLHTISNRISYVFDFRGQSLTIDTACSSSSNAVHLGYKSIINGDSEYSICGGANLILDTIYTKSVAYLNMTGKSGFCKAFDESADGFVRSEGCGVIVLKKLSSAIRDGNNIYCIVKGAGSNSDGTFNKTTFFAPSKYAQAENLRQTLINGNIDPADIDFFECHGTGTPVGDPIEVEGISMVLKNHHSNQSPLLIGSVKSNIGHLEPASGIASIIKCCLMFKHRQFVPNIHFNKPNPMINFNEWNVKVNTELKSFPDNKLVSIGINNFGATGSNVCIVLKEHKNTSPKLCINNQQSPQSQQYLIPFSSNSKKSLNDYQNKLIENLEYYSNTIEFNQFIKYQVFCKTLNFQQRSVIVSNSWNNLTQRFKSQITTTNNKTFNISHKSINPKICLVFCGQGPQYINMAKRLYENNQIFKNSMDLVNEKLSKHSEFNILEKLRSIDVNDKSTINSPLIAQTTLFMIQVSLFELYKHWGLNLDDCIMIGHSFGELTSTYCSGMLSLDDACYLVYQRARLQSLTVSNNLNKCLNNRMLVINIDQFKFNQLYSTNYPDVEICCFNSPNSIVIGGKENELIEINNDSKSNGIFSSFLGTQTAFHSSSQDIIKEKVSNELNTIYYSKPSVPIFSTVTGEQFGQNELNLPVSDYIFKNIREPVMFDKGIQNILNFVEEENKTNKLIFLELSPHPTLTYYIKQMIPSDSTFFNSEESIQILTSLNKNKNDIDEINTTISKLYCNGYNINFKSQFSSINLSNVISNNQNLPRYQWDDNKYFLESQRSIKSRKDGPSTNPLGIHDIYESSQMVYDSYIDINRPPYSYLKGHVVKDKYYFPGCGYINSIVEIFSKKDLIINHLEFKSPLILKENESKHLQTTCFKTSKNEYKINFNFKKQDNNSNNIEWVECSTGKIQLFNFPNRNEKIDLESLKSKCNFTILNKEELYGHIKTKTGLNYSNHFKRVEECYQGDGCTLAKISMDPAITDFKKTFLDPSIIDTFLHGFISYIDDPCQMVFDRVEDYRIYNSNIPSINDLSKYKYLYVYSTFLGKFGDSISSTLMVTLPDGTIIVDADRIVVTSLTPIKDQLILDNPNDHLFSNVWQESDSIISKSSLNYTKFKNQVNDNQENILSIINYSIKDCIKEKFIFRILQLSNDLILSNKIINEINSLLNNQIFEIDIEFTIGLQSLTEIKEIKTKLLSFKNNGGGDCGSLLIKELNLKESKSLIEKQLLQLNYFDIIILSNEISTNCSMINQYDLFKILNSKGYLVHFNNNNNDDEKYLEDLKNEIGFEQNTKINSSMIISQKPSITNLQSPLPNYDNIIIFTGSESNELNELDELNQFIKLINLSYNNSNNSNNRNKKLKIISNENENKIKIIKSIEEFNSISSIITNNSLIYFVSTINKIKDEEILKSTLDYIKINQYLIKNDLTKTKHIIISCYTQKETFYYSNSTILGSRRYFEGESNINLILYSIDFDKESLLADNVINLIETLTSTYRHSEYMIRNHIPYYERIKKETNLKNKFKSSSYQDNNGEWLLAKLDPNLEYKLDSKQIELDPNYIEIETKAVSINYKDNLIYRGLVPPELRNSKGDIHNPEFGFEFSGLVTRMGSNVNEYKIGDQVFGYSTSSTSSHIYTHKDHVYLKPTNLTHVEASSIPVVFMTSLYSIFNIGHLDINNRETILIHTGTGGVGLSALNILKWKKFNSYLFVTVGSKEKEQYLKDNYGDFITGIYSTRDFNYVKEIKTKLKQLNHSRDGVDLILNTLSNEYMDSNFKTLCRGGRIVDISVTHLSTNEYTDFNKFKYNIGYFAVEMSRLQSEPIKLLLKELANGFLNQGLQLIPIKEFPIAEIKNAIEYINERKLIGKISVNFDRDIVKPLLDANQCDYNLLKPNYKINENSLGKTILVTGQTGLILEILKWISRYSVSVKTIVVLSKSNKRWELEKLINQNRHIHFIFKSCDISNYSLIKESIDQIIKENNGTMDPIETIIHLAFQYVNHQVLEIGEKDLYDSLSVKAFGALNLHQLSIDFKLPIKQFILASSVTAVFGSPIQLGYTASNYFLDALARYRRSLGLPAISTFWGLFDNAGFISKQRSIATFIENLGFKSISVNLLLGSLDLFLQNQSKSNSFIVNKFKDSIINNYSNKPIINKIDFITNQISNNNITSNLLLSNQDKSITEKFNQKISELLSIDENKINVDIKCIDYGADSLVIINLKNWLDKEFKQNLFTISQLQTLTIGSIVQILIKSNLNQSNSNKLNNNNNNNNNKVENIIKSNDRIEFWKNEAKLNNLILNNNYKFDIKELLSNNNLNIFLTGTTGYLAIYLLELLIKSKKCFRVYCLVRNAKSKNEGKELILNNLKHHQLYNNLTKKEIEKIKPIIGDITKNQFGLSNEKYKKLSNQLNILVHCGANTNLISPYQDCKLSNVDSTKEMIKLSCYNPEMVKPILNISSFSIFTNIDRKVYEDSFLPSFNEIDQIENGYGQSKVISEYLLREASNKGIPTMSIRLPFLFSSTKTNIKNPNDFIQLFINSCFDLKIYPSKLKSYTNLVPVDWASEQIIKFLFNQNCWINNSDNNSNQSLSVSYNLIGNTLKISKILKQLSNELNLKEIDYSDWKQNLIDSKNIDCNKILILDPTKKLFSSNLKITTNTINLLKSLNSNYNDSIISINMIKNYLNLDH